MFKIKKCEVLFSFFQEILIRFYFLEVICKSSEEKKESVHSNRWSVFASYRFRLYLSQELVKFHAVITIMLSGNATNKNTKGK